MLLRSAPAPWTAEDTVLTVYTMYFDLQEADGLTERRRAYAQELVGAPLAAFLFPEGTSWDAPLDGSNLPMPAIPSSHATKRASSPAPAGGKSIETASPGSNNWAVGGAVSARGAAIVANDMHLGLRVPNIWYRARFILDGADAGSSLDATGVTLPGTPNIVAGSNGKIAWGFTNSYVDTSDVVILEPAGGIQTSIAVRWAPNHSEGWRRGSVQRVQNARPC
jgi:penicillin amidase